MEFFLRILAIVFIMGIEIPLWAIPRESNELDGDWTKTYVLKEGTVLSHTPSVVIIDGTKTTVNSGGFVNKSVINSIMYIANKYNGYFLNGPLAVNMSQVAFEAVLEEAGLL